MSNRHSRHRAAFALALRSISPMLAALHTSRLDPPRALTSLTCSRCGHALVCTRTRRSKKDKKQVPKQVLERSCAMCAFVEAIPIEGSAAREFRSVRSRKRVPVTSSMALVPAPAPAVSPAAASHLAPTPALKRPKKKAGLQELLARNRKREEQQRQERTGGGLSSFLEGLGQKIST